MNKNIGTALIFHILLDLILGTSFLFDVCAQEGGGTGKYLYRPQEIRINDTSQFSQEEVPRPAANQDSLNARQQFMRDSIETRMQFIRDSIETRMQFIRDSIAAREAFVRDSIERRERKIDSLNFLKSALPGLLEASIKTISEEIVISTIPPAVTEDLMLTNYIYITLPFDFTRPFTPWKSIINLSDKPVSIVVDAKEKKITSIQSPIFHHFYEYNARSKTLRVQGQGTIVSAPSTKYYKLPIDTVFYDSKGRIIKIKRYHEFYQVKNSYQKGPFVFNHLTQVRQFEYTPTNTLSQYQLTNFCDRWSAQEARKVCNIITYQIIAQGNIYHVTRKNDPANEYSDGEFTYEFGFDYTLKSVSFLNVKKTENWKTYIELNKDWYVSNYIYENQGAIRNSILINYYLDDPNARFKVETISCSFESDGVCYYQKNNMTGKSRTRDKLTLEWSPWR
jgi:hypothetical protein